MRARRQSRPVWLITLADLSLLLLGFFVLIQANREMDGAALAKGMRAGFGVEAPAPEAPAMALGLARVMGFVTGSASITGDTRAAIAWAREAGRDPRTRIEILGRVDGSLEDRDAVTRSGAILAADRARAVAAALVRQGAVDPARLTIATGKGSRSVELTVTYPGEPARSLLEPGQTN